MDVKQLMQEVDKVGTGTVRLEKCTCNDCEGYAPQGNYWGVCDVKADERGKLVVKRNRKACAKFRYYGGG